MFDYHSCGKHLGLVWYDAKPCPDCTLEHVQELAKVYEGGYRDGQHNEYRLHNKLNPGKPLTEHQIDRLE